MSPIRAAGCPIARAPQLIITRPAWALSMPPPLMSIMALALMFIVAMASTSIVAFDLMVIGAVDLTSIVVLAVIFVSVVDLSSICLASSRILPVGALTSMSPVLFVMMIFCPLTSISMLRSFFLSMISIFSLPLVSSNTSTWPLRDLMNRMSFFFSALSPWFLNVLGGVSLPFHSVPMTDG